METSPIFDKFSKMYVRQSNIQNKLPTLEIFLIYSTTILTLNVLFIGKDG